MISLLFNTKVNGFVFTRTPVCKKIKNTLECNEILTGALTLRNEESLSITGGVSGNTRNAEIHDPSNHGILLTIEKSQVKFVYDLQYDIDVFSEFREDVYEYSYNDVGLDPGHFCYVEDVKKCNSTGDGTPKTPDGVPLPWSSGRCCWCGSTPLYSGTQGTGELVYCFFTDVFLGRSVWTSKSCPRIRGPWYSGMRIGQWRWDFSIRILIEWYAPTPIDDPKIDGLFSSLAREEEYKCFDRIASQLPHSVAHNVSYKNSLQQCLQARSRKMGINYTEHFLNISIPEIYDDKFQIGCRITGSAPQTEAFPPSLLNQRLFLPTYPENDLIVKESRLTSGCGVQTHIDSPLQKNLAKKRMQLFKKRKSLLHANPENQPINRRNETNGLANVPPCLSHALLVPSEMVDVSGIRCDVIGTSTRVWGDAHGQFCDSPPGTCMGNQLGTLRLTNCFYCVQEDEQRISRGQKPKYLLGSHSIPGLVGDNPQFFTAMKDPHSINLKDPNQVFYFAWTYVKEHVTSIEIEMNAEDIVWLKTPSPGKILSIQSERNCIPLQASGCIAVITTANTGNEAGRFLVSIPYCVDAISEEVTDYIRPVTPIGKLIESNETQEFHFKLQSISDRSGYYTCKSALADSDGRRLDHMIFNISFTNLEHEYQGLQRPVWEPNINVSISDGDGRQMSLGELLEGFKAPLNKIGGYQNQFFGCLAKARAMIVSGVSFVGFAAAMYACGPSASFCLKCFGNRLKDIRHRQQKYLDTSGTEREGGSNQEEKIEETEGNEDGSDEN